MVLTKLTSNFTSNIHVCNAEFADIANLSLNKNVVIFIYNVDLYKIFVINFLVTLQ